MMEDSVLCYLMDRVEVQPSGCLFWTKATDKDGYGKLEVRDKFYQAHRLMYSLSVGRLDPAKEVHHSCVNRPCINPLHLHQVTDLEHSFLDPSNIAYIHRKKTHCKRGHPY